MNNVYYSSNDISFRYDDVSLRDQETTILMIEPSFFDVCYVINPYMKNNLGNVDKGLAFKQWSYLLSVYKDLGLKPCIYPALDGLVDMVFCANHGLPYKKKDGQYLFWKSNMKNIERREEVFHITSFYKDNNYEIFSFPEGFVSSFEGMGDAIWHPKRSLLWGGYGFRTDKIAYEYISSTWNIPIILLELKEENFYHLDTCFCVLDEKTVLIYPKAFSKEGLLCINKMWEVVIAVPENEAMFGFACNAHCPDGTNVLLPANNPITKNLLISSGFNVIDIDTSEFLKSGGSVFCMKMCLP